MVSVIGQEIADLRDGTFSSDLAQAVVASLELKGADREKVLVRSSVTSHGPGLIKSLTAPVRGTGVGYALHRIARSWDSESYSSYRAAQRINDFCFALYVVPMYAQTVSLTSRHGVTGEPTNSANFGDNANNTIVSWKNSYSSLLRDAESALGFPVKLTLETTDDQILDCVPQPITVSGKCRFLGDADLDEKGVAQFALSISPNELIKDIGIALEQEHSQFQGLPIGPGIAVGTLAFLRHTSSRPTDSILTTYPNDQPIFTDPSEVRGRILIAPQTRREDFEYVLSASAVIAVGEGMTGHCALMCRGFGITGVSLSYKDADQMIRDWQLNGPNSTVLVDGGVGRCTMSSQRTFYRRYAVNCPEQSFQTVRAMLNRIDVRLISSLSIYDQLHIASLKRAVNLIVESTPR